MVGLLQVPQGSQRALRRLTKQDLRTRDLSISAVMCFWSAWKGEVVNVIEMLTDKCVEVWDNLRLDPYSNERSLCVWK